jgi:hypothetical protein
MMTKTSIQIHAERWLHHFRPRIDGDISRSRHASSDKEAADENASEGNNGNTNSIFHFIYLRIFKTGPLDSLPSYAVSSFIVFLESV